MWVTLLADWSGMINLDPGISILEKMGRPIIIYAFLMVGLRLAGKRELAQLNAMDLIVLLTLSNTVQNAIIGPDNSVSGGIIGASTLLAVNYLVVRFMFNHEKIDRLIEGSPTTLVEHGRVQAGHLKHELMTKQELEIAAHKQGFGSLDQVEEAVLEPGGVVSFVGKSPTVDEERHSHLTSRLDKITRQLETLSAAVAARG